MLWFSGTFQKGQKTPPPRIEPGAYRLTAELPTDPRMLVDTCECTMPFATTGACVNSRLLGTVIPLGSIWHPNRAVAQKAPAGIVKMNTRLLSPSDPNRARSRQRILGLVSDLGTYRVYKGPMKATHQSNGRQKIAKGGFDPPTFGL